MYHAVVTPCCRAGVCEEVFQPRLARKNLKRYRRKGLASLERQMMATISSGDRDGARVLEIGGGIGTIQAELLERGAEEGEIVELVSAYEPYARELAREKGLESRSHFRVADVLEQPDAVKPATIVILNRVVCCSPDGVRLAETAARLAERILILSFPRDRLLTRTLARVVNAFQQVMGKSFRVVLHRKASLNAAAQAQGLSLTESGRNLAWEFVVLRRAH